MNEDAMNEASSTLAGSRREELLRQTTAANDGLWFYAVYRALGAETANRMNAEVVRGFSRLEMAKLMRALGKDEPSSVEEVVELIEAAAELFTAGLFEYTLAREGEACRLEVKRCFAYEGVKRAGVAEHYDCGPGQRLMGWLDAMGPELRQGPELGRCQMVREGRCHHELLVALPSKAAGSAPILGQKG